MRYLIIQVSMEVSELILPVKVLRDNDILEFESWIPLVIPINL